MIKLHLWSFGPDTVVAADETDVLEIMRETVGDDGLEDYEGETPFARADDEPFTIYDEDAGGKVTKLAGEWAAEHGRGWLCSSEY